MEDGYFLGLLFGLGICGVIVLMVVIANKRNKKEIEKIKSTVSEANLKKLESSGYHNYEANNNFVVGTSYIYDIIDEGTRLKVMLLYRNIPRNNAELDWATDFVFVSKEDFDSKKLKVGMCVKTLHNTAVEVNLKVKKILES